MACIHPASALVPWSPGNRIGQGLVRGVTICWQGWFWRVPLLLLAIQSGMQAECWRPTGPAATCPLSVTGIDSIAASGNQSVALRKDGRVVYWPDPDGTAAPTGLGRLVRVAIGAQFGVGLRQDGTVVRWGDGIYVPPGLDRVVAIAASKRIAYALRQDGTVVAWDNDAQVSLTSDLNSGVVSVSAAGNADSVAMVKTDGTVRVYRGATPPTGLDRVVQVSVSETYSPRTMGMALRSDGSVTVWGDDSFGHLTVPAEAQRCVAVAAGRTFAMALREDGRVVVWGDNAYGQRYVPVGLTAVAIAAGDDHALALRADGTVVGWGAYAQGQAAETVPDPGSGIRKLVQRGDFGPMALRQDGTMRNLQTYRHSLVTSAPSIPGPPGSLEGITDFDASDIHIGAIRSDGSLGFWGSNQDDPVYLPKPTTLGSLNAIWMSSVSVFVRKTDGTVAGWGFGRYSHVVPPPMTLRDPVKVQTGPHGCPLAMDATGVLQVWGVKDSHPYQIPTSIGPGPFADFSWGGNGSSTPYPSSSILALRRDGRVTGDSIPAEAQTAANNATAIANGDAVSLILGSNGVAHWWGSHRGSYAGADAIAAGASAHHGWVRFPNAVNRLPVQVRLASATVPFDGLPHGLVGAVTSTSHEIYDGVAESYRAQRPVITRVTYNGSLVPPTAPGTYAVTAMVDTWMHAGAGSAVLTITPATTLAPVFARQPVSTVVPVEISAGFQVVVQGVPAPNLTWQRSNDNGSTWTAVAGANAAHLVVGPVAAGDNGAQFRCQAVNSIGTTISWPARLTVAGSAPAWPVFVLQPESQSRPLGQSATFAVAASGSPSWRWQTAVRGGADFTDIPGATTASYTTPALTSVDQGRQYRCIATNAGGSSVSRTAAVEVRLRMGDVNRDGRVDGLDLDLVKAAFGGGAGPADLTEDGRVDVIDLIVVKQNLGL